MFVGRVPLGLAVGVLDGELAVGSEVGVLPVLEGLTRLRVAIAAAPGAV